MRQRGVHNIMIREGSDASMHISDCYEWIIDKRTSIHNEETLS